jgi:predicted  nucleic acid-binding Zn-ribbon protein
MNLSFAGIVMNKLIPVVVLIGGVVFAGALYFLAPSLEPAASVARRDADEHIQRALRLLAKFDQALVRRDRVLTSLGGMDVGVDLEDEYVQSLLDKNPELLAEATEADQLWANSRRSSRNDLDSRLATLSGDPGGGTFGRGGFGQGTDQYASAIRQGVASREEMISENRAILDQALASANAAVQADGEHPQAHEVKGIVQSYQGRLLSGDAYDLRTKADPFRRELDRFGREIADLNAKSSIIEQTGIDAAISKSREAENTLAGQIRDLEADAAELTETIGQMETRVADLRKQSDEHRSKMDRLEDEGVNFSDPDGGARFADAFRQAADAYREASRRADELEMGFVANATVDRAEDYVTGALIPLDSSRPMTPQQGFVHKHEDLAALNQRIDTVKAMLVDAKKRTASANEEKDRLTEMVNQSQNRVKELQREATTLFDELMLLESEAATLEGDAIVTLEAAASSLANAGRLANMESSDAGDRIAHLAADTRSRSAFSILADDRWSSARMAILEASAKLELGQVYQRRMRDASADAELIKTFGSALGLAEADSNSFLVLGEEAMDAGTAVVTDALNKIERVSRDLNNHWTLAALAAGAAYQLALLGDSDMAELALVNYRAVVEQRQDSPFVGPYQDRITMLEKRVGSSAPAPAP